MKYNWKSFLLIAVAVAGTAAAASAQDVTLRATVPFRFSINRYANLAPGNYTVTHQANAWWFRSEDSSEAVGIINAVAKEDPRDQVPSLTFACVRAHCQIQAIHVGNGSSGVEIPAPKLSKSDAEELAFVNVPLEFNHNK
jgi:hypothetical protein